MRREAVRTASGEEAQLSGLLVGQAGGMTAAAFLFLLSNGSERPDQ